MKKIAWNDLPEGIRSRKTVNWSELPKNIDLKTLPPGVRITAVKGEALEQANRRIFKVSEIMSSRVAEAGLSESDVVELLNAKRPKR